MGTLFKTQGRAAAMVAGMAVVRPKLDALVAAAAALVADSHGRRSGGEPAGDHRDVLLLHCWRERMRSCALVFLLQTRLPGLTVYVLRGGYKAFCAWHCALYCYLPANAGYGDSCHDATHGGGGPGPKAMTPKQRRKRAAREASAAGVGVAKREAVIAEVGAR